MRYGGFAFGANRGELERGNRPLEYGQNWGSLGQNWGSQIQSNDRFDNVASRGPPAAYKNNGFNSFAQYGNGPNDIDGPNFNSVPYECDFGTGRHFLGPQFGGDSLGYSYGGPASRPHGLSGSVRSHSNDDHVLPGPSANCVNVDRS